MNTMNNIIDSIIITLSHLDVVARPSTDSIIVLLSRIDNMIESGAELSYVIDMIDAEDSWVA